MSTREDNLPLGVSVHGVSETTRKSLQYFFKRPCKNYCEIVDEEVAQLAIIDLDGVEGRNLLQAHLSRYPDRPRILLALEDTECGDAPFVRKPLNPEMLFSAIVSCQANRGGCAGQSDSSRHDGPAKVAENGGSGYRPVSPSDRNEAESTAGRVEKDTAAAVSKQKLMQPASRIRGMLAKQGRKRRGQTFQAAMYLDNQTERFYIGSAENIEPTNFEQLARVQYNPDNYFHSYVTRAISRANEYRKAVLMTMPHGFLIALPDAHNLLVDIQQSRLQAFCALPIAESTLTESFIDNRDLANFSDTALQTGKDALLWKATLWASRGRVPLGTELTLPVLFSHWPNLTRLQIFPHAMRIAALWSRQSCSLLDTVRYLQIPQRYVFTFYSACHALDIASVAKQSTKHGRGSAELKRDRRRGLLGRILRHLYAKHDVA